MFLQHSWKEVHLVLGMPHLQFHNESIKWAYFDM